MERSEIAELIRQVNATYPNAKPVTPVAEPIWVEDLADLATADVRAAFKAYRRAGHAFPPGSADLRRLVLELAEPTPRFEHAWAAIQAAVARRGWPCPEEAQADLQPVPMAWDLVLAMGGWAAACQGGTDEFRSTDPGVWRSQAEHAWRGLVEQRRTDLAVADLDLALPRVRDAVRRLSGIPQPVLAPLLPAAAVVRQALPPAPGRESVRAVAERIAVAAARRQPELKPEYRAEIEAAIREGREATLAPRWQPFVEQVRGELEAAP